ncbi:CHAT domain-containing protein [bacterium]|nr:CHAT domain-containing protein [bacterium]
MKFFVFISCIILPLSVKAQDSDVFERADSVYEGLRPLPWSEKELDAISEVIAGKFYKFSEATEERFKSEAPKHRIIHLATHTIIDDKEPLYSKLVFAKSPNDKEDGLLHTYELYNMQLNADLAVLSACNTGSGKLVRGEGVMSLARGFFYAGCPSIVMSLWAIDDRSTSVLMHNFYERLSEGLSKDEALREAKLAMINSGDPVMSNPYYWAGFVAIGDTHPIQIEKPSQMYWVFVVPSVVILAGFFIVFRKKFIQKTL